MAKPNQLVIGDTIYSMTPAYIQGAKAMRRETPFHCNPHRSGSQREEDWSYGHDHEAGHEHYRFGKDLLAEPPTGIEFEEDPNVPRDDLYEVDPEWAQKQATALA
jgi:hypothetical protein